MNRRMLGGGVIALLLATVFALVSHKEMFAPPSPPVKVVIATSVSLMPGLVFVAQGMGFFAEEGLEVTVQQHAMGFMALQSLLKNEADLATAAEYPIAIAYLKGEKLRLSASICSSSTNTFILARDDRGIARPGDLKGKTIGVPFGTDTDFMLDMILQINRVPIASVRKVNLPPKELSPAILSGQVDAVSGTQLFLMAARKELGKNQVIFPGRDIYTETFNLVTSEAYVQTQPATMEKILRALRRAEKFIREHPVEGMQAMLAFVKMEKSLLEEIFPGFQYRLTLDQALITTLENQSHWAQERGIADKGATPDFLRLIYSDALSKVAPQAVTIIR